MPTSQSAYQVEKLQGEVERLVYSADETGFTICRLLVPGEHDLVTVVGSLPGIQPGERLSLEGRWLNHPRYGLQFQVSRYTSQVPATANAIKRYLSSNLVKGIGPVMAGRLVGSPKAIAIAVRNQKAVERHTALDERLRG